MTCSKCGECCKWLVFTIYDSYQEAKKRLTQDKFLALYEGKFTEDEKRYYSIRLVELKELETKTLMIVINKHKDKNRLEIVNRGKYRLLIYSPCPLLKDNLCSIWETKPDVCDYDKSTLSHWNPKNCTDKRTKKE